MRKFGPAKISRYTVYITIPVGEASTIRSSIRITIPPPTTRKGSLKPTKLNVKTITISFHNLKVFIIGVSVSEPPSSDANGIVSVIVKPPPRHVYQ